MQIAKKVFDSQCNNSNFRLWIKFITVWRKKRSCSWEAGDQFKKQTAQRSESLEYTRYFKTLKGQLVLFLFIVLNTRV